MVNRFLCYAVRVEGVIRFHTSRYLHLFQTSVIAASIDLIK